MQNVSTRICSSFSLVAFSLILALALQLPCYAQVLSTNFNSNIGSWVVSPSWDASVTWGRITTQGASNTGCIRSSAVCQEGSSVNSCLNNNLTSYFAASPSVTLTAGNTYQVAFKCSVATANTRRAMVGFNTSQNRSGATLIQNFGTITDNYNYQSYSSNFTVPTTGTYYLIFWGEQVAWHSINMWMDDFAVTILNSPPTASMSGPANNAVFNPGSMVNLQATVTDAESNVSKVEFYVNGSKVGEDATSPYSKTWMPTAGGTYTLTAKATDSYGLTHTSSSRTITLKSVPVVSLTYPAMDGSYPAGPMTFAATASDADGSITKVSFSLDEDFSTVHEDFTSPYTFDWTATPGSHSVRIEATDNEGYTNTSFGLFTEGTFFEVENNTCNLTGRKILGHTYYQTRQTLCAGGSASIGSSASVGSQSVQWLRKVGTSWQAVANATSNSFTTGTAGEYVAKWTYSNAATCTTAVDTVEVWNPGMNFAFDTSACAGHLVSLDSNYYRPPAVYSVDDNTQEIDTPQEPELNPTSPVTMAWQVPDFEFMGGDIGTLPLPTTYEEAWRGISYIRFGTPGPHQVKLIVTNNVLGCPPNEHTITFESKNVVVHAAPITTYNNQPAMGVAHAINGSAPYSYSWTSGNCNVDVSGNCDSAMVSDFGQPVSVTVVDAMGCFGESGVQHIDPSVLEAYCEPPVGLEGNIICNPSFELPASSGGSIYEGADQLKNLYAWGSFRTVDVFGNNIICDPQIIGCNPQIFCAGVPYNSLSYDSPTELLSFGENRYIGFYTSPLNGNERPIQNLATTYPIDDFYFFTYYLRASPSTKYMCQSIRVEFGGVAGSQNLDYPSLDLSSQSWKKFTRLFKSTHDLNYFIINTDLAVNATVENPNFSGCELLQEASYTFLDALSLFHLPRPIPNRNKCGNNNIRLVNIQDGAAEILENEGFGFEWTSSSGILPTNWDKLVATADPLVTTTYTLTFSFNGQTEILGSTTINILPPVEINQSSTTICEGAVATFDLLLNGNIPTSIQWLKDNFGVKEIVQQGGTSFSISNAMLSDEGNYFCRVIPNCGIDMPFQISIKPRPDNPMVEGVFQICEGVAIGKNLLSLPTGVEYKWIYGSDNGVTGGTDCNTSCGALINDALFLPVDDKIHPLTGYFFVHTEFNGCESNSAELDFVVYPSEVAPYSTCEDRILGTQNISNALILNMQNSGFSPVNYVWEKYNNGTLNWDNYPLPDMNEFILNNNVPDERYRVRRTSNIGCTNTPYEFRTLGNQPSYSGTLSFDGTSPIYLHRDNVNIEGSLTLNGTEFLARGVISSTPGVTGSLLTIKDNGQLFVTNQSSMKSACQNMWGGINYESSSSTVPKIKIENSTVADAYYGVGSVVHNRNYGDWHNHSSASPARINIQGSTFDNCFIGLELGHLDANNSYIVGNTFQSDHLQMKSPFNNGMFLTEIGIVGMSSFNFANPIQFMNNTFTNMGIGILDRYSGPEIHDNAFSECHVASIVGYGAANLSYHHNQIVMPSNLAFKSSSQMDQLGQQWVLNQPYTSTTPTYTYGLFFHQTDDNIHHRFEDNTIISYSADPLRYHVGLGNNGWLQKAYYTNNHLTGLSIGVRGFSHTMFYIKSNEFLDNDVAIRLDGHLPQYVPAKYYMDLKCNTFKHTLSTPVSATPNRKGLVVGVNTLIGSYDPASPFNFSLNNIGGTNNLADEYSYPNANVWPTASDRTDPPLLLPSGEEGNVQDLPPIGWEDVPNWISIENQNLSGTPVKYYRYINEFVQSIGTPTLGVEYPLGTKKMGTQGNFDDPNFDPANFEFACDNPTDPWPTLFPARIAVVSSITNKVKGENSLMLDPVPNPAQSETKIPLRLEMDIEQAIVQIVDLGTGKVLQSILVKERGTLDCILNLSKATSGIFAIRLLVDGKPSGTRKLSVVK